MPNVILYPDHRYATAGDDVARSLAIWAVSLDQHADQRATRASPWLDWDGAGQDLGGQHVMSTAVAHPNPGTGPSQLRPLVLDFTLAAYRRAARWAGPHDWVAIAMGHGYRTTGGDVGFALAPGRYVNVEATDFDKVLQVRRGEAPERALDETQRFLSRVADVLRSRPLRRVDILSCSVGVGAEGRHLVRLAAEAFGATVRALRGDLVLDYPWAGNYGARGEMLSAMATVVPTGRTCRRVRPARDGARSPYCRSYRDAVPTDPRLWTTARPHP